MHQYYIEAAGLSDSPAVGLAGREDQSSDEVFAMPFAEDSMRWLAVQVDRAVRIPARQTWTDPAVGWLEEPRPGVR